MRKTINICTLLFLGWLIIDAFHITDAVLNFLLVGVVPGTNTSLSPTMMLAIMTAISGIIIFELLARRVEIVHRIRQHFMKIVTKRERLPKRRFGRV